MDTSPLVPGLLIKFNLENDATSCSSFQCCSRVQMLHEPFDFVFGQLSLKMVHATDHPIAKAMDSQMRSSIHSSFRFLLIQLDSHNHAHSAAVWELLSQHAPSSVPDMAMEISTGFSINFASRVDHSAHPHNHHHSSCSHSMRHLLPMLYPWRTPPHSWVSTLVPGLLIKFNLKNKASSCRSFLGCSRVQMLHEQQLSLKMPACNSSSHC